MKSSIVVLLATIGAIYVAAPQSLAQTKSGEPHLRGASFMLAKYASTQTMTLYGAYGRGPAMALVGVVWNPRSGNERVLVGGGTRLRLGARARLTMLAAVAGGSDGAMLRLYAVPVIRKGRLTFEGTATTYVPLGGDGGWRASVDPLVVSLRATPLLGVGLAGVVRARADRASVVGVGPVTTVRVAGMTIRGEMVALSTGAETRIVLGMAF